MTMSSIEPETNATISSNPTGTAADLITSSAAPDDDGDDVELEVNIHPEAQARYDAFVLGPTTVKFIRSPATNFDVNDHRLYVIDDLDVVAGGNVAAPQTPEPQLYLSMISKPEVKDYRQRISVLDPRGNLIAHKCSKEDCAEIDQQAWKEHCSTVWAAKHHWARPRPGKKLKGAALVSFGSRQNVHDQQVGPFPYRRNMTNPQKLQKAQKRLQKLVQDLERLSVPRFPPKCKATLRCLMPKPDPTVFNARGVATQVSFGNDKFWPPVHFEKHTIAYSTLSCCQYHPRASVTENEDNILCFVVLPSCDMAIPMFAGDVLVIDPSIPHCFTLPRAKNVFTITLHASRKTFMAKLLLYHKNDIHNPP